MLPGPPFCFLFKGNDYPSQDKETRRFNEEAKSIFTRGVLVRKEKLSIRQVIIFGSAELQ
jgi:hypothetical protein